MKYILLIATMILGIKGSAHNQNNAVTNDSIPASISKIPLVKVYPMPFKDELNFKLLNPKEVYQVIMYNQVGKEVERFKIDSFSHPINTSNWQRGIYYAVIMTGEGLFNTITLFKY